MKKEIVIFPHGGGKDVDKYVKLWTLKTGKTSFELI